MAAGDYVLTGGGQVGKLREDFYTVSMNGATPITIKTRMRKLINAQATWAADIGSTGHVIEAAISGGTLTLTASGAITVDAFIRVVGYP